MPAFLDRLDEFVGVAVNVGKAPSALWRIEQIFSDEIGFQYMSKFGPRSIARCNWLS